MNDPSRLKIKKESPDKASIDQESGRKWKENEPLQRDNYEGTHD